LDQLANGVFHGLLFRPQARRRIMRWWKNWALSVAKTGLPTLAGRLWMCGDNWDRYRWQASSHKDPM
jgi:hypothetical protein